MTATSGVIVALYRVISGSKGQSAGASLPERRPVGLERLDGVLRLGLLRVEPQRLRRGRTRVLASGAADERQRVVVLPVIAVAPHGGLAGADRELRLAELDVAVSDQLPRLGAGADRAERIERGIDGRRAVAGLERRAASSSFVCERHSESG